MDPAAIAKALAPNGAARSILVGIRPYGTGINLAVVEAAQAAGFETRMGVTYGEREARRQTTIELVAAVIELAATPGVDEVVVACAREHVELLARRVRALGKRIILADHARTAFTTYGTIVDGLIELPTACWPQTLGRAA